MRLSLISLLLLLLFVPALADDGQVKHTSQPFTMRSGPSLAHEGVIRLELGTEVQVMARNQLGDWLFVISDEDQPGWLPAHLLPAAAQSVIELPLHDDLVTAHALDLRDRSDDEILQSLLAVPQLWLPPDHSREIYQRGLSLGRDERVAVRIGDCNSVSDYFLATLTDQADVDLGSYAYLDDGLTHFRASFDAVPVAADVGFNAYSVFDPFWADADHCAANETPLDCVLRRDNPAVAMIMFGANDLQVLNTEQYEAALVMLIERLMDGGVIPVLSTFPNNPAIGDRGHIALRFNAIVVALAQEYDVPLMNFWLMSQSLPDYGIAEDNAHLTARGPTEGFSEDAVHRWGFSARNLLALAMLDQLLDNVMTDSD